MNPYTFQRRKMVKYFGLVGLSALTSTVVRPPKILGGSLASSGLDPNVDFILVNAALSGDYALEGRQQLMATRLALDEVNTRKVFPRPLKVLVSDNKCLADATAGSIRSAFGELQLDRLVAIVGGSSSKISRLQSEVARSLGIVHLDGIAQTIREEDRYGFSTYLSVGESVTGLFHEFASKRVRSVLAISHDYDWGRAQALAQSSEASRRGIAYTNKFVRLHHDMHVLSQLKLDLSLHAFDAVIINEYSKDLIHTLTYLTKFMDSSSIYLPLVSDSVLKQAPKGLFNGVRSMMNWTALNDSPNSRAFVRAFESRFGEAPGQAAHQAYSQLSLLAEAYRQSGSLKCGSVSDAISNLCLEDFVGMNLDFRAGARRAHKDSYLVTFGSQNSGESYALVSRSLFCRNHVG